MALHWVRIIESGHQSTLRLFELGLSFRFCKRSRRWPSLETMNSFLQRGVDEGDLGTTIEWAPCTLSPGDYERVVREFMQGESFQFDDGHQNWNEWFSAMEDKSAP